MKQPVLSLRGVTQVYATRNANGWEWTRIKAVDSVDLDIHEGETLAIVGESGSGKSTLAKLLLMLNSPSNGEVTYRGVALPKLDRMKRSEYRRQIQAVFQDPSSSLNPRMRVEQTLGHVIRRHDLATPAEQREFTLRQLSSVGLLPAEQYLGRFPHQLSGGQQQRVAIARAMMLEPKIVIADEPLSSLDVSVQAQVLQLMRDLRVRTNVGFVLISHDLGAMHSIADRTAVMYRGRIVEIGASVYDQPAHPYTRLLLDARLSPDPRLGRIRSMAAGRSAPARTVDGEGGCRFRSRCPNAIQICAATEPELRHVGTGATQAACHRAEELLGGVMTEKKLLVAHTGTREQERN